MLRENLARLLDKLQKLRERFISLKLPRFLSPIDSHQHLILWLVIVLSLAFIEANLINWLKSIIGGKMTFGIFSLADPNPFFSDGADVS